MKLSKEANEDFEWLATHFLDFANFKTHFEDFAEGKTSHPLPLHHLPHKLTCGNIFLRKKTCLNLCIYITSHTNWPVDLWNPVKTNDQINGVDQSNMNVFLLLKK